MYGNFLFDLSVDPHERVNLWDSDDHQEVRAELIARAEFLVRDQKNDYGKILYEYNQKSPGDPTVTWEAEDWFAVPWGCDVIV